MHPGYGARRERDGGAGPAPARGPLAFGPGPFPSGRGWGENARVSVLAAVLTHPLVAQAGSGSSGFSGGGGGGGGGFSGGGSSDGGGGGAGGFILFGIAFVVVLVLAAFNVIRGVRMRRARRAARDRRDAEVRSGAAVAFEDDDAFDAEALSATATRLVLEIQAAWDRRDEAALATVIGGDLLEEWNRRLDDLEAKNWHNRVEVTGEPVVRLIGLVNREDDADDRVVFHVELDMNSWVSTPKGKKYPGGAAGPQMRLSEYWTIAKHEDAWRLVSIEGDDEGAHHLTSQMVLDPTDDPELAARSRTELAVGDAAPGSVAGLVSTGLSDDAHAAALDLSLADDRWSPDVLGIAVDRAIAAWATAVDGPDEDLLAVADPDAAETLLHGTDRSGGTRTVVRGPRIEEATISRVSDEGAYGTMTVDLRYRARWYRQDRDTAAVIEGSEDDEQTRTDTWTFALGDDAGNPWRLIAVGG